MRESQDLPRPGNQRVADEGVALVKRVVSRPRAEGGLGSLFRELPTADVGIDGQLEIVDGDGLGGHVVTGRVISVQIKSGASYFAKGDDASWFVYIDKQTMNYWKAHSLPVILVLVDTQNGKCYWTRADDDAHEELDGTFRVEVSKASSLDTSSFAELVRLAENTTDEGRRLAGLQSDLPYIRALAGGKKLSVDLCVWGNKSSGRTDVSVGYSRPDDADSPFEVIESFTIFGGGGKRKDVERIFPWASAVVDSEFLETLEDEWRANHLSATGVYDSETGTYIDIDDSYNSSHYYDPDSPTAYSESSGEVWSYRFSLRLNELGRSFLRVTQFLEGDTPADG